MLTTRLTTVFSSSLIKAYGSLFFKHYSHYKTEIKVTNIEVLNDAKEISLDIANPTEYTELKTSVLPNGLYAIRMSLYNVKYDTDVTAMMYFYVNDGKTYLCSSTIMSEGRIEQAMERRATISNLLKTNGITPQNSLSTDDLCYPWHTSLGRNDVPNWIALAKEITKDEWSDGLKAFAIHEWMVNNLAYDYYRSDYLEERRAAYYKDYSGKYDTFDSKVGTCFDISNAFVAMCRSVGVPAVTLDIKPHTWNLIYVNGKWIEVDITTDLNKGVYVEDMTAIRTSDLQRNYSGYGTLEVNNTPPVYINYWLMTYEKANDRYLR